MSLIKIDGRNHIFSPLGIETKRISVSACVLFSSLPIGAFQWPITSSIKLTFNLN